MGENENSVDIPSLLTQVCEDLKTSDLSDAAIESEVENVASSEGFEADGMNVGDFVSGKGD